LSLQPDFDPPECGQQCNQGHSQSTPKVYRATGKGASEKQLLRN